MGIRVVGVEEARVGLRLGLVDWNSVGWVLNICIMDDRIGARWWCRHYIG